MVRKTPTSFALVAACAMGLALPEAQAQIMETQVLTTPPRLNMGNRADWMASRNNAAGGQYDRLLEISPEFRQSRMRQECGPITDFELRASCIGGFSAAEDQPSLGWHEQMTGGSTGTMSITSTPGYSLDMYGAGAGR